MKMAWLWKKRTLEEAAAPVMKYRSIMLQTKKAMPFYKISVHSVHGISYGAASAVCKNYGIGQTGNPDKGFPVLV